ncbi:MAG: DUF4340 domain-containing protein [Thermodesulfobacteriota bacterium]
MTWKGSFVCWLVAALLAAVYVGTADEPPAARDLPGVAPRTPVPRERGYEIDPAALRSVEVRRGERAVLLERGDRAWKVVEPADRTIPGGLVQAFVDQLVDGGESERVADDAANPAYGFESPQLQVTATDSRGKRLTLVVGTRTPTGTAAYGRIEEDGIVVLVGLNLLYYADLLLG